MKLFVISAVVITLLGGMLFAAAKSNPRNDVSFSEVQTAVIESTAKFYDVRTPEEFVAGHFASAINLPLGDLQAGALPEVPKDTKIYVQCQSGNRSAQATRLLKTAGYTNVTDLGGISDVQRIGGKLET